MKHTPGPWIVKPSGLDFIIEHSDGNFRSHVARLFDSALCEEHGSIEANAHLIAAAPTLIAVLQQIVEDTNEYIESGDSDTFTDRMRANCEDAEWAIAKSKGGAL